MINLFPNYEIRQEYSVNKVNKSFSSGREKFDWVILGLNVVIECHGLQHYTPVCFGGITMTEAKRNFEKRVEVDKLKQDAAEEAGWAYLVVKYDEQKITPEELGDRVNEAIRNAKPAEDIKPDRSKSTIQSRGFNKDGPKRKIQSRGFHKPKNGYKWPKRKVKEN